MTWRHQTLQPQNCVSLSVFETDVGLCRLRLAAIASRPTFGTVDSQAHRYEIP